MGVLYDLLSDDPKGPMTADVTPTRSRDSGRSETSLREIATPLACRSPQLG